MEPSVENSEEEYRHGKGYLDQLMMLPKGTNMKHGSAKTRCPQSQPYALGPVEFMNIREQITQFHEMV